MELAAIHYRPLIALLCPLAVALLVLASKKRPNLRESFTIIGSSLLFLSVLTMTPHVLREGPIHLSLFNLFPNVDLLLNVDAFGLIFATTTSSLWILVSFYSIGYMRSLNEHAQGRYYTCFALTIFGAVGVALSGNLVTMFIFYEILTVSTYPLVVHEETMESIHGGRKYLVYLVTSGVILLFAVLMTYYIAGTTDFAGGGILKSTLNPSTKALLQVTFFLFMLGFMKSAWMPFHSWLPAAMVAPTPVSALLHAVAVVKLGVFGIVRTVGYVFGPELMGILGLGLILATIASITMLVGSFLAIAEDNLKRRLAYSTVSQLSYILFGAGLISPYGIQGAMIHIPFHGFMKITLFLCAGAIAVVTGKKAISQLAGIGKKMPITMTAFTIGAVGMLGAPPVVGFISKWYLCLGTIQNGHLIFLGVILFSSLLDVIYFFPIIKTAFFDELSEADKDMNRETDNPLFLFMVIPLAITGLFSIIFFLNPRTFGILSLAEKAIKSLF